MPRDSKTCPECSKDVALLPNGDLYSHRGVASYNARGVFVAPCPGSNKSPFAAKALKKRAPKNRTPKKRSSKKAKSGNLSNE